MLNTWGSSNGEVRVLLKFAETTLCDLLCYNVKHFIDLFFIKRNGTNQLVPTT